LAAACLTGALGLAPAAAALTPPAALTTTTAASSLAATALTAPRTINTNDQAAVTAAYAVVHSAEEVPASWSGSASGCNAGAPSAATQQATFTAINTYRAMVGLDPVSEDTTLSANAQQAALIIAANNAVTHHPATSSACYTDQGGNASATSNLVLGTQGARAVSIYMQDPGANNLAVVGHRRWIIKPHLATMGSGSTLNTNAIQVIGGRINNSATNPTFLPWPSAGYFPAQWIFDGMSWSVSSVGADFHSATVRVTKNGSLLSTSTYTPSDVYGVNTLVWKMPTFTAPADGATDTYTVTVSGVKGVAKSSYTYSVKVYQVPETFLGSNVNTRVSPSGQLAVGSEVRYVSASWGPTGSTLSYQWRRGDQDIPGATSRTYTVTEADKCYPIGLRLTVTKPGAATSTRVFDAVATWPCQPPVSTPQADTGSSGSSTPGTGTAKPVTPFEQITITPDMTGDGRGEVLAVDASGTLVVYPFAANTGLATPGTVGSGFGSTTIYAPGDWNGDGRADLMAVTTDGRLLLYPGKGNGNVGGGTEIGHGWSSYRIIPSGDLTGDGVTDLLAIDSAGKLWVYAGSGAGGFKSGRIAAGHGWNGLDLYAAGDLNGDGRADILMINGAGELFAYAGRGNGTFEPAKQVGRGWTGLTLVSGADLNGDGKGDIVGRTSAGTLHYYAGRGNGTFQAPAQIGNGW
jgi:uncharacterized protein YkwD